MQPEVFELIVHGTTRLKNIYKDINLNIFPKCFFNQFYKLHTYLKYFTLRFFKKHPIVVSEIYHRQQPQCQVE